MSTCNCQTNTAHVTNFAVHGFEAPAATALQAAPAAPMPAALFDSVHALQLKLCVQATANGHQVCANFPIFGNRCINLPFPVPAGSLRICAETCGFPIPRGLKGTLYVNDNPVWSGTIVGSC